MLTISRFEKKYPGSNNPVLSVTALRLEKGIYCIKGENGSGKTSLIKSIAGLLPFTGSIAVNNFDLKKQRIAYTKLLNYAEAEPQYPSFLTGKELLDFYISTKGDTLPHELMASMGVEKFLNDKIGVYSSGMMKKLSLVLAFTGNPKLILLDEPLVTLDKDAVEKLQHSIAAYHKQGVSFIITSHQTLDSSITVDANFIIRDQKLLQE
jgi:ABC-2 type transport system ATP-binding protein